MRRFAVARATVQAAMKDLVLQRIADPDLPLREVHFTAPLDERPSTRRRKK